MRATPKQDPSRPPRPSPRRPPGWLAQALVIAQKDLKVEMRSGEVVTTSGFFSLLVVVMASMSFYGGPETRELVAAGAIWLAIAFSVVLALGRGWQREKEDSALTGLLVTPLARSALFVGKSLSLLAFIVVVELIVVPVAAVLFALDLSGEVGLGMLAILLVASPGLAATATLFGSMTVRTRARELILAIVLFPLLAPVLLTAVTATRSLLGGVPLTELVDSLGLMVMFDFLFITGGLGMFGGLIDG